MCFAEHRKHFAEGAGWGIIPHTDTNLDLR